MWSLYILLVATTCLITASPILESAPLPESFIVGGVPAPDENTPVALVVSFVPNNPNYGWLFTGSLITTNHVLTVGQALHGFSNWHVGVGNVNRELMQYFESSISFLHDAYNPQNLHNNLGIILMPQTIPPSLAIPIALPPDNLPAFPMYTYYGFGITNSSDFDSIPYTLKLGRTHQFPSNQCQGVFGGQLITESSWCGQQFQSGLCHGDQGGPLIPLDQNYIFGMASFWMEPCHSGNPDVFIVISHFRTWINNIIQVTLPPYP